MKTHTQGEGGLGNFSGTLALVGAGKMGGAMLMGWLELGLDPGLVAVIDPQASDEIAALAARGVRLSRDSASVGKAAVVVIAVKPQEAPAVVAALGSMIDGSTLVVSVMAGRTMRFLEQALPPGTAIVRAMPNTPAAIGRGISAAVPNAKVSDEQRKLTHRLLAAIGAVEWVEDDALIDAVTAVSGSGPAYVFLLAESLARAGHAAGLPAELAARLARATVAGAGELLHRSPLDPTTLRQNVTSPGGTTAAALSVLMAPDGLDPLMQKAVAAAAQRSRELAG